MLSSSASAKQGRGGKSQHNPVRSQCTSRETCNSMLQTVTKATWKKAMHARSCLCVTCSFITTTGCTTTNTKQNLYLDNYVSGRLELRDLESPFFLIFFVFLVLLCRFYEEIFTKQETMKSIKSLISIWLWLTLTQFCNSFPAIRNFLLRPQKKHLRTKAVHKIAVKTWQKKCK